MPPLTPDALVYETTSTVDPQVSPDGTLVVYSVARADRAKDNGTSQVWLLHIDGTNHRQLTWSGERNREPRWSPDGSSVAFVTDRVQHHNAIMVLPIDTPGEAKELTRHRSRLGHLAWSPDGRFIAYTATFDPDNPDEQPPEQGHNT